ncbi:MAG: hypothetical protein Kow00128_06410 [Deltaproteobacteria bacterium]
MHLRLPARGRAGSEKDRIGKEVMDMAEKKDCGCGCVPPGKTAGKPKGKEVGDRKKPSPRPR